MKTPLELDVEGFGSYAKAIAHYVEMLPTESVTEAIKINALALAAQTAAAELYQRIVYLREQHEIQRDEYNKLLTQFMELKP